MKFKVGDRVISKALGKSTIIRIYMPLIGSYITYKLKSDFNEISSVEESDISIIDEPTTPIEFLPGDRVAFGEVEGIIESNPFMNPNFYPLRLNFGNNDKVLITKEGKYKTHHTKPCIRLIERPSPKPKKKVKKTIEQWINIYEDRIGNNFDTKEQADFVSESKKRIACVKLTGEYEVEE